MDPISLALGLVSFAAPKVGRWLFGDDGEKVATDVVGLAQSITGTTTPSAAEAALRADPQLLAEFQRHLADLDTELEKAYLADRQSARERDKEFVKAGRSNIRADLMVLGATAGLIACVAVLAFFRKEVPGEVVGILSTVAGIFGSCLKDAFAFEFGSSRGSKEKDDILSKALGGKSG